jgi:hypothetical protein
MKFLFSLFILAHVLPLSQGQLHVVMQNGSHVGKLWYVPVTYNIVVRVTLMLWDG